MQKITPHLWYDKNAGEAARFYTSVFAGSAIKSSSVLQDTPSGAVEVVNLDIYGQEFVLLGAGPEFKFTPAISFLVGFKSEAEVDETWAKLSPGGTPLMELGSYPFSSRYGWIQDKYGLSWQIMYMGDLELRQKITPTMMFVGDNCGKAEEAITFYTSIFKDSKLSGIMRYGVDSPNQDKEGTVMHAGFSLEGYEFAAMDSAGPHHFTFNEAVSFIVNCQTQEEIDYYWSKLSAVPESEQCGWLKDKYGISWQIVPVVLSKLLASSDPQKVSRVTESFLKMKKMDISELERAYSL